MNLIFEKTFPLIAAEAPIELPEDIADTACVAPFAADEDPLLADSPGNIGSILSLFSL